MAYFYFSFNDGVKQNTVGMLKSLIKQLCCNRPDTPQPVMDLRKYKENGHQLGIETLLNTLTAIMYGFSGVYIVIDAMDECPDDENRKREDLLDAIHKIHNANCENIHLLCTSRRELDIEIAIIPLLSTPTNAVDLASCKEAVDHDIRLYIDKTFSSPRYSFWPTGIKTEAREKLIENADGM